MKVTVNCPELVEERKDEVLRVLANIVREIESLANLNINTLSEIIIPDDFDAELVAFQEAHGILEVGRTNDEQGMAAGKVIEYLETGELVQSIFLDKQVWLGMLYSQEKEDHDMAIHLLHHELAHVQGNQYLNEIFGAEFPLPYMSDLQSLLTYLARIVWEEYYANRVSGGSMPMAHGCRIPILYETVDYVEAEASDLIATYRLDGDIGTLFQNAFEVCWRLMYSVGSTLGYLHYFASYFSDQGDGIREIVKNIGDQLESFREVWTDSGSALSSLFESFPNWSEIEDLEELSKVVLKAFHELGLFPRQTKDGVYVDVPFSTESPGGQE
jgi:hypothetical protein